MRMLYVPFKLPLGILKILDAKARALGHTRSAYIRYIIMKELFPIIIVLLSGCVKSELRFINDGGSAVTCFVELDLKGETFDTSEGFTREAQTSNTPMYLICEKNDALDMNEIKAELVIRGSVYKDDRTSVEFGLVLIQDVAR